VNNINICIYARMYIHTNKYIYIYLHTYTSSGYPLEGQVFAAWAASETA